MIGNREKGQGLTEFALILPILLLLLLGIIEGGRIIWAYITVQNAAREAARYAVTGQPFACPDDPPNDPDWTVYCDDPTQGDPWTSQVLSTTRVAAIKNVAFEQGRNLAVSVWATGDINEFNTHKNTPGAFGVAVIGQSAVYSQGLANYGGEPGWNVRVETYYNVEMIDPVFDVVMGGQIIHLAGEVELQNEGIDATSKGYTGGITFDPDTCAPNCGVGRVPFISVQDEFGDFEEPAGGNFSVSVNDHQPNTTYNLWFVHESGAPAYQTTFTTDNLGGKLVNYTISVSAPEGIYKIYTTVSGSGTPVASCLGDLPTNAPCFTVAVANSTITARNIDQGNQQQQPISPARWPISSSIPIYLFGHDTNAEYTIKFNGYPASAAPGTMRFQSASTDKIPTDAEFGTNEGNDPAYYIATGYSAGPLNIASYDSTDTFIVDTDVELVEAELEIAGEIPGKRHPAGDVLGLVLRNHAPLQQYQIFIEDGLTPATVVRANENGELGFNYVVPEGVHVPGVEPPVQVPIYTRDYGRGPNLNIIAGRTINVFTPNEPYINVPGGARWPAGSPINIQLRRHEPSTDYVVYLQKGPADNPSFSEWINDATITTYVNPVTGLGEFDLAYTIPFSYSGFFTIRSFKPDNLTDEVAAFDIEVTASPYITIDKGKRWPPGSKIVIRLHNHAASTPYDVWLDKGGTYEDFVGTVIVDSTGEGPLNYTIPQTLPLKINPGYPVESYRSNVEVAETDLEIQPADLVVTKIEVPDVTFDVDIPITLTIANNSPVSITETYFDTDMYIDPDVAPNLLATLPPGEYKKWIKNVLPNDTVTIEDTIVLYGQQSHQIYARTDTSNLIAETDDLNNMLLKTVEANCPVEIVDEFPGDGLGEWTQTDFGDSGPACPALSDLPAPGGGNEILNITWPAGGGVQGFTRQDDFLGTPAHDKFYMDTSSGGSGGGPSSLYLRIQGKVTSPSGASLGASRTFNTTQPNVHINFDYLLRYRNLDAGEEYEYWVIIDDDTSTAGGVTQYKIDELPAANGQDWQSYPTTNWTQVWTPRASLDLTLTPNKTHKFTFGLKTNKISRDDEYAYAYIDNLLITEDSGPQPPPTVPNTIEEFHYDPPSSANPDSFGAVEKGVFYNFTGSDIAGVDPTGDHKLDTGAWADGSLYVEMGYTGAKNMSGGRKRTFTVPASGGCVTVQGYYRIVFPGDYESDEHGEALLAIDSGLSPRVLRRVTGGSGGIDTGWVAFNESFSLTPGVHTLILGGYNDKSTENPEVTKIWFDDVYVVDTGTGTATSSQTESSGTLIMSNRGSGALTADDNGSNAGYHLMHQTVGSGPFEVYVRLDQTALNGNNGLAGLEVRADSIGPAAKLMFVYRSNDDLRVLSRVSGAGAVNEKTQNLGDVVPIWLKINRNGDEFNFSYSASNSDTPPSDWVNFKTVTNFSLPDSVEVGLINVPASSSTNYQANFKHFHICAASAPGGTPGAGGQGYLGSRCGQVEENGNGLVVIDAINTILNQSGGGYTWKTVSANDVLGEPSMQGLEVSPDTGADLAVGAGPHATYQVNVESAGTYYVWVAGWGPNANGDDVHVGLNDTAVGVVGGFPTSGSSPAWVKMSGAISVTTGINTVDLWGKEDGARVFKILLTQSDSFVPAPDGIAQSACTIISEPHIPPKLKQCINPIRKGDFEGAYLEVSGEWTTSNLATVWTTVNYNSNHGAGFPTFGGRKPVIYQTFELPTWILSDTTAFLKVRKGVDLQGTSNPEDKLYFALRRESDNFNLVPPILLADGQNRTGDSPPIPDLDPFDPKPEQWTLFDQDLFAGLNPLSFLEPGEKVRVYFYSPDPGVNTSFFLDDISLTFCTTQPEPEIVANTGKISGITKRSNEPLGGATVWAYATTALGGDPGPVFKTYSIQDGTFRFYNLPPGDYLVYASITDASGTFFATYRATVFSNGEVKNVVLNLNVS